MAGGRADLHVHSNRSDGSDTPARVVARAKQAGLAAMALTDHDTTEGLEEALEAGRRLEVEVIPGIEISCEHGGREVHVLAWFIRPDARELGDALARMRDSRRHRVERMVERINARGIPLDLESVRRHAGGASIGRPHIADALVQGGFVTSYDEVWRDYLRPGGFVYVEREKLPLGRALSLIARSGGVAALAHPTLNLDLAALETIARDGVRAVHDPLGESIRGSDASASVRLHALETNHPRVSDTDARALGEICRRYGLIESGGSDCHGGRRGDPAMASRTGPLATVEALRRLRA